MLYSIKGLLKDHLRLFVGHDYTRIQVISLPFSLLFIFPLWTVNTVGVKWEEKKKRMRHNSKKKRNDLYLCVFSSRGFAGIRALGWRRRGVNQGIRQLHGREGLCE